MLSIQNLTIGLARSGGHPIVRDVDLTVRRGERVALVGESGSGKTLTSLCVIGLQSPEIVVRSGRIEFDGVDLLSTGPARMNAIRGARIAMVYQNPLSSLNPVRTIGWQIGAAVRAHERVARAVLRRRVVDLLGEVGIDRPDRRVDDYPHQFSGGMRQRAVIAIAISCSPDLLLADEPTTALDVTTQARILELLDRLVADRGMGVVFVTHDLAVAAGFCDRVDVMYAGRIVESGPAALVTGTPCHPYTEALVDSQCTFDLDPSRPIRAIDGQPPLAGRLPGGCAFHPRCPEARVECARQDPAPVLLESARRVECHVRAPVRRSRTPGPASPDANAGVA
jgi:oligopeptide/dipeptide ABC transporter ATP-binding protein